MKTNNNNDQNPNPYSIDKLSNIKPGVKIRFLKYWIAGVSFLLSSMTPQLVSQDGSTELLAMILLGTLLIEYVANNMIIWMNNDKQHTYDYLPFGYRNRKSAMSLFSTMAYVTITFGLALIVGSGVNILLDSFNIPTLSGLLTGEPLSMEPFTFALFFTLVDIAWYQVRKLIIKIKKNIKKKDNDEDEI